MSARRGTTQYNDGCRAFVAFAVRNCTAVDGKIYCPCKNCRNNQRYTPDYVLAHLTGSREMTPGYNLWYMHGKTTIGSAIHGGCLSHPSGTNSVAGDTEQGEFTEQGGPLEQGGDMRAMFRDAFGVHDVADDVSTDLGGVDEGTSCGVALKYQELLQTAEKALHLGTKHSKLSATVHMYNFKCVGGISNKIFSDILDFINQLLPPCDETLPINTYEAKKFLSSMGLGYEKIPACRNDCMLFWKDNKDLNSCTVYGEAKWRADTHIGEDGEVISSRKKRPVKMLRWFPLIPRLQRLFMSEHTAPYMRWHAEGRTRDGVLRHPADGEAWRSFDILHPDFMADSRNVRLGLIADGFNSFGNMSTSHSIWPVMLVAYNLPPWICIK